MTNAVERRGIGRCPSGRAFGGAGTRVDGAFSLFGFSPITQERRRIISGTLHPAGEPVLGSVVISQLRNFELLRITFAGDPIDHSVLFVNAA